MPIVTANQVTYLRLLLLPVPVWMMYRGFEGPGSPDRAILVAALAVFVLLGLTDALDGYLARKYGSTPIGALLDPIADKIFLVASYVPMSDLGLIPHQLVQLLFVRELAVTWLRTVALEEGFQFRTSAAAKLKTTVQMAGSGMILLIVLFPDPRWIFPILGVSVAGSLVPGIVQLARGKRPGWMAASAAALFSGVALSRVVFPPRSSATTIAVVILGFTLYSGIEYVWGMRRVLAERIRRAPVELLRVAATSLVIPVLFIPALDRTGNPTVTILSLLAAEVAVGGLDNFLVQYGVRRGARPDLLRTGLQLAAGVFMVWVLEVGEHRILARSAVAAALAVTLADFVIRVVRNREILRRV